MGPTGEGREQRLTPQQFAAKWASTELKERAGSQEHFIDLCRLVGHETPAEADPKGEFFTFERAVAKVGGDISGSEEGGGSADVWYKGRFAWEYKGPHKDLDAAYRQLQLYRINLENPPLLVVSDMDRFVVHTNFERTAEEVYSFTNEEIGSADNTEALRVLTALFKNPDSLKPGKTREAITEEVAAKFATLAEGLRERGEEPHQVAHFLMKIVFCLFAEDIELLPENVFTRLVESCLTTPERFAVRARELFGAMSVGGEVNWRTLRHFNGGLFADDEALELGRDEIRVLLQAARLDWSSVEPAIFGTLFERSLDPGRRAQLGAQYTSRDDILKIVEPVLMDPLRREWDGVRQEVGELMDTTHPESPSARTQSINRVLQKAQHKLDTFASKLREIRVLDPACGSGNFLYVSLNELLNLEKEVSVLAGRSGLGPSFPEVNPGQLFGIELDPYARELTQVSIWIGYLQWLRDSGFGSPPDPILGPMTNVFEMDAILTTEDEGTPAEPAWPEADVIVGNPPFLGTKKIRPALGDVYADGLKRLYQSRLGGSPDLVCYWFERARELIETDSVKRVGLIATSSIRHGKSNEVLRRIKQTGDIFMAWSARDWVLDGAAVDVSMVGFDNGSDHQAILDGEPVKEVAPDLSTIDCAPARKLPENMGIAFEGVVLRGKFQLEYEEAQQLLSRKGNPNGQPNSDVVRPRILGKDIVKQPSNGYVVDFGIDMSKKEASRYEAPFGLLEERVYPERQKANQASARERWWIHWNSRPKMREALSGLQKYIATPRVAKHRVFVFVSAKVLPDAQVIVFARDDHYFLGILQARPHVAWSLKKGSELEDRPRYTTDSCFRTYPFPEPTAEQRERVAEAARELDSLRGSWLQTGGLTDAEAKKRTMTNLYNLRPAWLREAHDELNRVIYAAYGWPEDIDDEEILGNLLALNLDRSGPATSE